MDSVRRTGLWMELWTRDSRIWKRKPSNRSRDSASLFWRTQLAKKFPAPLDLVLLLCP